MKTDLSQLRSEVELLDDQVDDLLEKLIRVSQSLRAINNQMKDLPLPEELADLSKEASSIVHSLESIKTLWTDNDLPSVDELRDYVNVASEISAGLRAA